MHQNRVFPDATIHATPARGLIFGNRGCLHDSQGKLGPARWRGRRWITCLLRFKDRRRPLMQPGRYTELFFLDEAVALAAGHRPCAECRRADYLAYCAALGRQPDADALDRALHADRIAPGTTDQRTFTENIDTLPDGSFLRPEPGAPPHLLWQGRLWRFQSAGYNPEGAAPQRRLVTVLTPRLSVAALAGGYRPLVHPSAT